MRALGAIVPWCHRGAIAAIGVLAMQELPDILEGARSDILVAISPVERVPMGQFPVEVMSEQKFPSL